MGYAIDPLNSRKNTSILASITALETVVMVILGQVSLMGADNVDEARANLSDLRANCYSVRETLMSMTAIHEGYESSVFDDTFVGELDHIFGGIHFSAVEPN